MRAHLLSFVAFSGLVYLVSGAVTPFSTSSHTSTSHVSMSTQLAAPKDLASNDDPSGGLDGIFGLDPPDDSDPSSSDGSKTETDPFAIFGSQPTSTSTSNTSTSTRKDSTSTTSHTDSPSSTAMPTLTWSASSTPSPTNTPAVASNTSSSKTWKLVGIATVAFASVGLILLAALTFDTWSSFLRDTLHLGPRRADTEEFMPDWEKASWECAVHDDAPGRARLPSFLNLEGTTPRWRGAGRKDAWGVVDDAPYAEKRVSGMPPPASLQQPLRSPSIRPSISPQPAPGPLIFRHASTRSSRTAGGTTPQLRPLSNPFSPPQEYTVQMAQAGHVAAGTATALSPKVVSPRMAGMLSPALHADAYDGIDVTDQVPRAL